MVVHHWMWPVACGLWPVACGLCPRLTHWWWYVGYFVGFVTYGQGRWLYVVGFFFDLLGFGLLSFILRAFHLWFHSTSLLGALIL